MTIQEHQKNAALKNNGKIKFDKFKNNQPDSPGKAKGKHLTIIEVNNRGSPDRGEQRNKTKIAAAMHL